MDHGGLKFEFDGLVGDLGKMAVASGVVIGAAAAWGAVWLTRTLKHDARHTFRSDSLVGAPARVITAIPEAGYGEVRLVAGGHVRKFSARADRPIETGTEVWVSYLEGDTDDSGLIWAGEVCFREDFEDARAFGLLGRRSGEVS